MMSTLIYLASVFFLMAFAVKRPFLVIPLAILLTMVFERFFTLTPFVFGDYVFKIYPLDILLITAVVVYLNRGYFKNIKFLLFELIIVLFIFICAANLLRAYFSQSADIEIALSSFKNYAFYAVFYFLTMATAYHFRTNFENSEDNCFINTLKKTFILGGIFIIPLFFGGFFTGQSLFTEFTPLSTEGSRALAPSYAFYLLIALLTFLANPTILQKFNLFNAQRFQSVISWLFILGILFSLSRHLWLALILGVYLIWRYLIDSRELIVKTLQKPFVGALAFLVLIYLSFSFLFPSATLNEPDFFSDLKLRFESFFNPEDVSFNYRAAFWKESFTHLLENFLWGIGFGQEITFFVSGAILTMPPRELHNSLYAILLQMGIIGFLPFLAFILWCFIKFFTSSDKEKSAYSFALLTIFLFSSLFGTYLEINLLAIFFWVFLAMYRFQILNYPKY